MNRVFALVAGGRLDPRLLGRGARYLVVGGLVALFYLGVYALFLWFQMPYVLAILCAQVIAIAVAFPNYRRYVFGPGESVYRDFARFLSVWVGGAIAGLIGTPLLVELLHWNPFLGQVAAMIIVTTLNFVIHRFWTFAPKRPAATPSGDAHRH